MVNQDMKKIKISLAGTIVKVGIVQISPVMHNRQGIVIKKEVYI